jgi:predicted nuclease of restriction endonuclease-like (RecB) superfamily
VTPEEAIKDPLVLEFLDLEDDYSESKLEEGLIDHLAEFLLELGDEKLIGEEREKSQRELEARKHLAVRKTAETSGKDRSSSR